ncbi:hypothetical protein J6590_024154 [Homalodisca vitripennis]|nr:hypothetical protein J6590_024154 [Homalodisca vitripennis]
MLAAIPVLGAIFARDLQQQAAWIADCKCNWCWQLAYNSLQFINKVISPLSRNNEAGPALSSLSVTELRVCIVVTLSLLSARPVTVPRDLQQHSQHCDTV